MGIEQGHRRRIPSDHDVRPLTGLRHPPRGVAVAAIGDEDIARCRGETPQVLRHVATLDGCQSKIITTQLRQQKQGKEVVSRADAAFARPEIYEALEKRGVKYAIRIPANDSLERDIAELLTRRKAQPQAGGVVQELSLPSGELEDGAAGGGKGGASTLGSCSRAWASS